MSQSETCQIHVHHIKLSMLEETVASLLFKSTNVAKQHTFFPREISSWQVTYVKAKLKMEWIDDHIINMKETDMCKG